MSEKNDGHRINIRITSEIIDYLDQLVAIGIHGKTKSEVAKSLISNELERLVRVGLISKTTGKG